MIRYTDYLLRNEYSDTLIQTLPMDSVKFVFCPERITISHTCD